MEKSYGPTLFMWALLIISVLARCATTGAQLRRDFYALSCPMVEDAVSQIVTSYVITGAGYAAGLVRLAFHDCFVQGCDGSVLLDASQIGNSIEKNSPANAGLHGFEIIDEIKATLEDKCPGTVSCADILMLAARDACVLAGLSRYQLSSGRRDRLISIESEASKQLPAPFKTVDNLIRRFDIKGFSIDEMVVLSGAHSIGQASCIHFEQRLYNYSLGRAPDPTLDPGYAAYLKPLCSATNLLRPLMLDSGPTAMLDSITSNILDNQYYVGLRTGKALLASDQELIKNRRTRKTMKHFALHGEAWAKEFGKATVKLSLLDVLTGDNGEIRSKCRFVN